MTKWYNDYNPILNTDSYKYSHYLQYPNDVKRVSAYIEPRWGNGDVMFFGFQMFLKEYLRQPIYQADIDEAEEIIKAHGLPFNRMGFERIVNKHGGYWPVIIQALPEGTVHDHKITQVQVHNIDPELPWVTTFIETAIMRAVWYPCAVATRSFHAKKILRKWMLKTCDNLNSLNFKLHDFGCRGVSSRESAGIGGCAHLVNFRGTDTIMALVYANNYYSEKMAGFSIPAAEHSTITAWGKEGEFDAYTNMSRQFGEWTMYAMVLDSYDVYNALENLIPRLYKDGHLNAVVGLRLDSGDPVTEPARAMNVIADKFGFTTNSKGYRVLPPYIRIVQGDGVSVEMIDACCDDLHACGWSLDNIGTFGMGGELLQKLDRDTHGYAMKCNAVNKQDEQGWYDISKNPVGDKNKASKAGRRAVIYDEVYHDVREDCLSNREMALDNLLRVVYENGKLLNEETFSQIRARADEHLEQSCLQPEPVS
ncbi:MAG TPA: nicotinate phosphoribosyltransferase [Methylomirabilota bacterium]|nr:nicotinate phosphoribosyltransferase [Methylomirabilota bacterium]